MTLMTRNKTLLMCGLGFVGAAVGALLAEALPEMGHNLIGIVVQVALWAAVLGMGLTAGLFTAVDLFHRKPPFQPATLRRGARVGGLCGAISGASAQMVYSLGGHGSVFQEFVFRPACWGIMGGLLGFSFARAIPNLGARRGALGGALGGFVGGIAFTIACNYLPQVLGRMAGVGLLGASLGLTVVAVEVAFRKASLEVFWGPNEKGTVSLGPDVVYVGGGQGDQVYAAGARPKEAGFVVDGDHVEHIDVASGKRTRVPDGSRWKVGRLALVVHEGSQASS